MYKCDYLKIKITVYRKHLAFCDSFVGKSFAKIQVESTRNLKNFSFFKMIVWKWPNH